MQTGGPYFFVYGCDVNDAGVTPRREVLLLYKKWQEKEALPYGRIHDGRHTYITLSLQGVKKEDDTIVQSAAYIRVFQSAGHSLPKEMQNMSTKKYNEDVNARWDVTRFWDEVLEISVAEEWAKAEAEREAAYEQMTEFERDRLKAQKERRMEKARQERLKGNPPEDVLQEYESQ